MIYMGKREQGVQVSAFYIPHIITTQTFRHYLITTGAPLSGFYSGSCLVVFLFPVFFTFLIDFNVTTCEKQQNTNQMNNNEFQKYLYLYISSIKTDSSWCQITMFCLVLNITGIKLTGDYETFKCMW